jgi:phosphatidate cytidylyltransferase
MRDILIRSVFGIVFLFVIFVPFSADLQNGSNLFVITLFIFTLIGIHELFDMDKIGGFQSSLKVPALLIAAALFLPIFTRVAHYFFPKIKENLFSHYIFNEYTLYISLALVITSVIVFSILIFKAENVRFLYKKTLLLSIFYPILPNFLLAMAYAYSDKGTKELLLIVLLPVYLNDSLAYLFGRFFGKRKLIPSVSPKKTVEGFIGGMIGAAVVMLVFLYFAGEFTTYNIIAIALTSIAASILATLGDLFESKLKRAAGVKDSGKLLPGHGGILDRTDAMLFVAPILYVILMLTQI